MPPPFGEAENHALVRAFRLERDTAAGIPGHGRKVQNVKHQAAPGQGLNQDAAFPFNVMRFRQVLHRAAAADFEMAAECLAPGGLGDEGPHAGLEPIAARRADLDVDLVTRNGEGNEQAASVGRVCHAVALCRQGGDGHTGRFLELNRAGMAAAAAGTPAGASPAGPMGVRFARQCRSRRP